MTPQELVQAELQQQVTGGRQRETQMRAQIEALRQTNAASSSCCRRNTSSRCWSGVHRFTALANSQEELMDSLKHKDERRMSLIDTKGLAGKEESFLYWRTHLEAFIPSVFGEFDEVPPWCKECAQTITETDIENAWGEISPTHSREAFSIIRSAGKNCRVRGMEALGSKVRSEHGWPTPDNVAAHPQPADVPEVG